MIGIYKITNKINNKCYIGQSRDIEKRWKEHIRHSKDEFTKNKPPIHRAINKYGPQSFTFEILVECSIEDLDELEKYYIKKFNSTDKCIGYNIKEGGNNGCSGLVGENNPNAVLNNDIVKYIRECYKNGIPKNEVYIELKNNFNLNYNTFSSIWQGRSYKYIMPEVFSKENINKHRQNAYKLRTPKHCQKFKKYALEIKQARLRGERRKDVYERYKFITFHSFNDIWYNRTFKYIVP